MHPVAEPTCTECRAHSSTRCKTGRPRNVRQFVSAGRATNKTKAFEWRRHFSGSQIATGVRQEMTYLHVHTQRLGGPLYSSGINFSPSPPHPGFHFIPPSPGHSSAFCLTNQRGGFLSIRAPGGWQLPCQTMQTGPSDNFHDAVSIDWQPAGLPFRQSEPPIGRVRRAFSTSTYYYRKRAHWMEPAEATQVLATCFHLIGYQRRRRIAASPHLRALRPSSSSRRSCSRPSRLRHRSFSFDPFLIFLPPVSNLPPNSSSLTRVSFSWMNFLQFPLRSVLLLLPPLRLMNSFERYELAFRGTV